MDATTAVIETCETMEKYTALMERETEAAGAMRLEEITRLGDAKTVPVVVLIAGVALTAMQPLALVIAGIAVWVLPSQSTGWTPKTLITTLARPKRGLNIQTHTSEVATNGVT